jgi:hypothetical protein
VDIYTNERAKRNGKRNIWENAELGFKKKKVIKYCHQLLVN